MESREDLLKRIELLESRLGILEDIEQIQRLQHCYGYYIDLCLWGAMVDLFSDDCAAIEIGRRGRYVGKENVLKFLRDVNGGGHDGLRPREIVNHMQSQGVITVAPDRQSAKARWRAIIQVGGGVQRQSTQGTGAAPLDDKAAPGVLLGGSMMYAEGAYENTYVKEDGVWKIALLYWVPTFYVSHAYERMWFESNVASTVFPPQVPPTPPVDALGRQFIPFHYRHPITGAEINTVAAAPGAITP